MKTTQPKTSYLIQIWILLIVSINITDASVSFTDDFNGIDTPAMDGGLGKSWEITGNAYRNNNIALSGTGAGTIALLTDYQAADSLNVEVDFLTYSKWSNPGILFNYSKSAQSGLLLRLRFSDGSNAPYWQLLTYNAGSLTQLAIGSLPTGSSASDVVPIGNWRRLKLDSTEITGQYTISITNSDSSITYLNETVVTDTSSAKVAGYTGIYFGASNVYADNFQTSSDYAHAKVDIEGVNTALNPLIFGQYLSGSDTYNIFQNDGHHWRNRYEGNGIWNYSAKAPALDILSILQSYSAPMLRYPGALDIHNFNWKDTIGPIAERDSWRFGLDEFMEICESTSATPSMVISEYIGSPQDAADLVEYLNAPAIIGNEWALKRAENGHLEPYDVVFFEIGNESWVDKRMDTTTGPRTAKDSAIYANQMASAMKAVDPTILCGFPAIEGIWAANSWPHIGSDIDYIVYHTYPISYYGGDISDPILENTLFQSMLVAPQASLQELSNIQQQVQSYTGRSLPISVTEFNMGPTQNGIGSTVTPYRHTFAAALANADYIGELLTTSETNIQSASYWQWLNDYFGSIFSYANTNPSQLTKANLINYRPQHFINELWGIFQGENMLNVTVDTHSHSYAGSQFAPTIQGDHTTTAYQLSSINLAASGYLFITHSNNGNRSITQPASDEFILTLNNMDATETANFYNTGVIPSNYLPPQDGLIYRWSFEAKWTPSSPINTAPDGEGRTPIHIGMQAIDHRGLTSVGALCNIKYLENAENWTLMEGDFRPAYDGVAVVFRMTISPTTPTPVSGILEIRNFKLLPWINEIHQAKPALKTYASESMDGSIRYITALNLSDKPIKADLGWNNFSADSALVNEVTGLSLKSTNLNNPEVGWSEIDTSIPVSSNSLTHIFPPYSASNIILTE